MVKYFYNILSILIVYADFLHLSASRLKKSVLVR